MKFNVLFVKYGHLVIDAENEEEAWDQTVDYVRPFAEGPWEAAQINAIGD